LRADWSVTIMPGRPKWSELFLILYRTPFSTELKVNKTDAVTVCLFKTTSRRNQQLQRATMLN